MQISPHEPAYSLNRSAVDLKLKLFEQAEEDAKFALDSAQIAKAYFRRGQARRYLGKLNEASQDLSDAQRLQPGLASIEAEIGEIKKLKKLPEAELRTWVAQQGALSLEDIFGSREESQRRVDEIGSMSD